MDLDATHLAVALGTTMVIGLPVVYLTTKHAVASGLEAVNRRLGMLRDELIETRTELKSDIERQWNFVRTVNNNVQRIDERVRALENEWSDGK